MRRDPGSDTPWAWQASCIDRRPGTYLQGKGPGKRQTLHMKTTVLPHHLGKSVVFGALALRGEDRPRGIRTPWHA